MRIHTPQAGLGQRVRNRMRHIMRHMRRFEAGARPCRNALVLEALVIYTGQMKIFDGKLLAGIGHHGLPLLAQAIDSQRHHIARF